MSRAECLRRLQTTSLGRIGVSIKALPAILAVTYCLQDELIHFRAPAGTGPDFGLIPTVVAFEVDGVDPSWQAAWSVLVVGRAEVVPDPTPILDRLRLISWAPGEQNQVLRMPTEFASGRRTGPAPTLS